MKTPTKLGVSFGVLSQVELGSMTFRECIGSGVGWQVVNDDVHRIDVNTSSHSTRKIDVPFISL